MLSTMSTIQTYFSQFCFLIIVLRDDECSYPESWEIAAQISNIGEGKGIIKSKRTTYEQYFGHINQ